MLREISEIVLPRETVVRKLPLTVGRSLCFSVVRAEGLSGELTTPFF